MDALPTEWKAKLHEYLCRRRTALENDHGGEAQSKRDVLDDLAYRLTCQQLLKVPDTGWERYILIVIDDQIGAQRMALARLAIALFKKFRGNSARRSSVPMLFRTGLADPVAVQRGIDVQRLFPQNRKGLPGLMMPILETIPSQRVDCVILVTEHVPLDWEEACEMRLPNAVVLNFGGATLQAGQWIEEKLPTAFSPDGLADEIYKKIQQKILISSESSFPKDQYDD